nr:MAG TPA: hypothetical protein [Caudoviricetes sp.]
MINYSIAITPTRTYVSAAIRAPSLSKIILAI